MGLARKTSPWSVKGIDEETRDVIRTEAKASEQTIGAWINKLIIEEGRRGSANDAGDSNSDHNDVPPDGPRPTGTAVASPIDVAAIVERELAQAEGRLDDALRPLAVSVHALASRLVEAEASARRRGAHVDQRRLPPAEPPAPADQEVEAADADGVDGETVETAEVVPLPDAPESLEEASLDAGKVPDPGDWAPPEDPDLVESLTRDEHRAAPQEEPAPTVDLQDGGQQDPERPVPHSDSEAASGPDKPVAPVEDFNRLVDADDLASAADADDAMANASIDRRLEALAKEIREEMSREGGTRFTGVQGGMDTRPDLAHREALETAVENAVAADSRRRRRYRTILTGTAAAGLLLIVGAGGAFLALPDVAERAGLGTHRAMVLERGSAFFGDVGPALRDAWKRVEADVAQTMGTAKRSDAAPPASEDKPAASETPGTTEQVAAAIAPDQEEVITPQVITPQAGAVSGTVNSTREETPASTETENVDSRGTGGSPREETESVLDAGSSTTPDTPVDAPVPQEPTQGSNEETNQESPQKTPQKTPPETPQETQVAALPPAPPVVPEAPAARLDDTTIPSGPEEQAVAALQTRARSGDVLAQYQLAVLYIVGTSVDRDAELAANWFREAAIQGEAAAQYNLAVLYERGEGVRQDDIRALLWYHSAADQSHPLAQLNLARFYALGRGVPQSYEEAARWYEAAAAQGMAKAYYNLSEMYRNGLGVARDAAKAEELASEAIRLGWDGPIDPDAASRTEEAQEVRTRIGAGEGLQESLPVGEATVLAIQETLREDGLYDGRVDGLVGPKTRAAIRAYESIHGLPQTGAPTEALLDFMRVTSAGAG